MTKRRRKKHIRITPERQEKTKAMKALWQIKHSQVTAFWHHYLQDLATERPVAEKEKRSAEAAATETKNPAHRDLPPQEQEPAEITDETQPLPSEPND